MKTLKAYDSNSITKSSRALKDNFISHISTDVTFPIAAWAFSNNLSSASLCLYEHVENISYFREGDVKFN